MVKERLRYFKHHIYNAPKVLINIEYQTFKKLKRPKKLLKFVKNQHKYTALHFGKQLSLRILQYFPLYNFYKFYRIFHAAV